VVESSKCGVRVGDGGAGGSWGEGVAGGVGKGAVGRPR